MKKIKIVNKRIIINFGNARTIDQLSLYKINYAIYGRVSTKLVIQHSSLWT